MFKMDTNLISLGIIVICATIANASWGSPGSSQYHIQTDEGPERYFRYQTDSGQYRKEKRLEDGTVIGTDAWIDAAGYLRQKDYIADKEGYRILKSKTVYVGVGRPIQEAIKAAKKSPPTAGILVSPGSNSIPHQNSVYTTTTSTTTHRPSTVYSSYDYPSSTPVVYIRPHAEAIDLNLVPAYKNQISTTTEKPHYHYPSNLLEPPFDNRITSKPDTYSTPIAIYSPSSTPTPFSLHEDLKPIAVYPPSSPEISSTPSSVYRHHLNNELAPPLSLPNYNVNVLPISSTTQKPYVAERYEPYLPPVVSTTSRPIEPIIDNNINIKPIFNRNTNNQNSYQNYRPNYESSNQNNIGNGYDPQYPYYDGVSVTKNGFRYYLPRQYHEEENSGSDRRAGSYGYIDPFGIRRVVYYNTSPDQGFVHRKNNRYVGFNATPYDPRPI